MCGAPPGKRLKLCKRSFVLKFSHCYIRDCSVTPKQPNGQPATIPNPWGLHPLTYAFTHPYMTILHSRKLSAIFNISHRSVYRQLSRYRQAIGCCRQLQPNSYSQIMLFTSVVVNMLFTSVKYSQVHKYSKSIRIFVSFYKWYNKQTFIGMCLQSDNWDNPVPN